MQTYTSRTRISVRLFIGGASHFRSAYLQSLSGRGLQRRSSQGPRAKGLPGALSTRAWIVSTCTKGAGIMPGDCKCWQELSRTLPWRGTRIAVCRCVLLSATTTASTLVAVRSSGAWLTACCGAAAIPAQMAKSSVRRPSPVALKQPFMDCVRFFALSKLVATED